MKKNFIVFLLVFVLLISTLFTGCSSAKKLYLFNYGDYISPEVYELFEKETGIKVVYDEYAAPEDLYAKFTSGTVTYDLICSSDYMLEKLIGEGLLQEINYANVENFKNIDDNQIEATKNFDPEIKYTVPHFWGTLGLLYNTETVNKEDLKSWDVLFSGKYKNKIIMPNSERDAFFIALASLGYDPNTTDKNQLEEAAELLKNQKNDVAAYLLDEAARVKIESENADIAAIYNGEAYLAFESNDKLDFYIPDDKTCIWLDSFAIPKNAINPSYAEQFLNFLCREDIAKINFEYIYYSTPNKAVLESLDSEILSETAIFPDAKIFENACVFKYLGPDTEKLYSTLWKNVKA